jgi:hypothetical protein
MGHERVIQVTGAVSHDRLKRRLGERDEPTDRAATGASRAANLAG